MVNKQLAKYLTLILRHKPEQVNAHLDSVGYLNISIDELAERMQTTTSELITLVEKDEKQRFNIRDNKIRANFGHSVNISLYTEENQLKKEDLPEILYHGTKNDNLHSIKETGLKPMERQFVHLSRTRDWALEVGRRFRGTPTIITIDVHKAKKNNVKFWNAGPKTIISTEIPCECMRFEH
ncbi:MAG: RNA 2'-phosphotransferase [Candidatus Heimdallarchaeota archaeon]|nr:RNA 2'-phosphotransferase [Candidatus Heimdallarchaeota archaeon]